MPQVPKKTRALSRRVPVALKDGDVYAVPVGDMGFCLAVIARAPAIDADVRFAFVYLRPEAQSTTAMTPGIDRPDRWGKAWLGLVVPEPFLKGRWKRCGSISGFDRDAWPIPPQRQSAVDETDPVETWGIDSDTGKPCPEGEMWSIEVPLDEPTMTLIDNLPANRAEALRFPAVGTIVAASRLETSLKKLLKGQSFTFHETPLATQSIDTAAIKHWSTYAKRVRKRRANFVPQWQPAGKKTDRELAGGEWLVFPLRGGGFGAGMLIEKPPKHLRTFSDAVVMGMRRRWDHWPRLQDVTSLTVYDGAYVAQTSLICVRDGRWRVLGRQSGFDAKDWPWPLPWQSDHESKKTNTILVQVPGRKQARLTIAPTILKLDPHAGKRCAGMCTYWGIEEAVPNLIDGTHWSLRKESAFPDGVVTPQQIDAWRQINAEIRRRLD